MSALSASNTISEAESNITPPADEASDIAGPVEAAEFKCNLPLDATVKSVPSPSIFSPSSPNVKPTFAGMLTSFVAVKSISAVLVMAAITGDVKVLFVKVCDDVKSAVSLVSIEIVKTFDDALAVIPVPPETVVCT